ncbi:MAG: ABC transporter ATP-binding protein [bacterium]|nr:ABC transporter ATP-binding protein [bacterium]
MILDIKNLKTYYQTEKGVVKANDGISLSIAENEVFGLAGESGCGKSTLIRTIIRLVPKNAHVTADRMNFDGEDILAMPEKDFREKILWQGISLVPQSAMSALNPVYRVGDQIIEAIQAHTGDDKAECVKRVATLFEAVGLQSGMMKAYPHEFSGGMRQRAMIAMALALNPALIIMDEPTTGLDVLVQERILRNLKEIRQNAGTAASILLITHDISVIAEMSDRIGIMYAGRLMEVADSMELFNEPYHPYTLGLKNAFPSIQAIDRELISIPGSPPNLLGEIPGCLFALRCPFVLPECEKTKPPDLEIKPGHFVHCIRTDHVEEFRNRAGDKKTWQSSKSAT